MIKLQPFQIYFTILYLFGLNSFISFSDQREKQSSVLTYSLRILNILVNVFIVFTTHINFHYARSFISFAHMALAIEICINFVAIFENMYNLYLTRQILHTISFTIKAYESSFKVEFPYASIQTSIKWKCLAMIIAILSRLISHYTLLGALKNISWTIFNLLRSVHLLHLIFYIEFVRTIITGLSQSVLRLPSNNNYKDWLHVMCKIKLIYLKLWRITQMVNSLFGWFLVTFILEISTKLIYYAYYIFVYVNNCRDCQLCILRKYLSIFFFAVK